jgi:hypothetical protein
MLSTENKDLFQDKQADITKTIYAGVRTGLSMGLSE